MATNENTGPIIHTCTHTQRHTHKAFHGTISEPQRLSRLESPWRCLRKCVILATSSMCLHSRNLLAYDKKFSILLEAIEDALADGEWACVQLPDSSIWPNGGTQSQNNPFGFHGLSGQWQSVSDDIFRSRKNTKNIFLNATAWMYSNCKALRGLGWQK